MQYNEFEEKCNKYKEMIEEIIKDDQRFYRFEKKIKWSFSYDENIEVYATCGTNNGISINVAAVDDSLENKTEKDVEYFLLHEIRHLFQNSEIDDYLNGRDYITGKEVITKWIKEKEKYVKAVDCKGKLNKNYFYQDCEIDAFAFSYAVMKYKYGNIDYLYLPEENIDCFNELVIEWIETFKNEKL